MSNGAAFPTEEPVSIGEPVSSTDDKTTHRATRRWAGDARRCPSEGPVCRTDALRCMTAEVGSRIDERPDKITSLNQKRGLQDTQRES